MNTNKTKLHLCFKHAIPSEVSATDVKRILKGCRCGVCNPLNIPEVNQPTYDVNTKNIIMHILRIQSNYKEYGIREDFNIITFLLHLVKTSKFVQCEVSEHIYCGEYVNYDVEEDNSISFDIPSDEEDDHWFNEIDMTIKLPSEVGEIDFDKVLPTSVIYTNENTSGEWAILECDVNGIINCEYTDVNMDIDDFKLMLGMNISYSLSMNRSMRNHDGVNAISIDWDSYCKILPVIEDALDMAHYVLDNGCIAEGMDKDLFSTLSNIKLLDIDKLQENSPCL